jgi:NADPH-dependent glutamate synthase beta subunit-like oxidoreductase
MKACVIGAGPAGLYTAKLLLENNIDVKIFEKSDRHLGNYKYADAPPLKFDNLIKKITFNADHTKAKDEDCDFYVVSTGGIPRQLPNIDKSLYINGIDIIKDHFSGNLKYLGEKVCIIGMGNVTMDILKYIKDKCKEITVVSRGSLQDTSFDNHKIREIVESQEYQIRSNSHKSSIDATENSAEVKQLVHNKAVTNAFTSSTDNNIKEETYQDKGANIENKVRSINHVNSITDHRIINKIKRRENLFKNICEATKNGIRKLNLLFNTEIFKIERAEKIDVTFKSRNSLFKSTFDTVISSIGFIPNKISIDTKKPVFYVGWVNKAQGNIQDSQADAQDAVKEILQHDFDA